METIFEDAQNRIEQDVLLMANGLATKDVKKRLSMYRAASRSPAGQASELLRKYKAQLYSGAAQLATNGLREYVPGEDVAGDELRVFEDSPLQRFFFKGP